MVDRDCLGHVPPLPAELGGAVGQVDVVAVEPVTLVQAAELFQHLPSEKEEGAEQPVRRGRLDWMLVQEEVAALALLWLEQPAQRRAADHGPAGCRGASARRLGGGGGGRRP